MTDGLTNQQRARIWLRRWNRTFVGKAVVESDFTFRSVNDQFCKIIGLTPADLIGHSFADITPEPVRSLDVANARLVREGKQDHYILPKVYQMPGLQRKTYVAMMVEGVHKKDGTFDCFQSEIIELSKEEYQRMMEDIIKLHVPVELELAFRPKSSFVDSIVKYWKILATVVGVTSWVLWELMKMAAAEGKNFWQLLQQLF